MVAFLKSAFCILFILSAALPFTFAQESAVSISEPPSPPVDIQFSMGTTPKIGEELELKITVIPEEDLTAEITCLLPDGIEIVRQKGLIIMPYRHRGWPVTQEPQRIYNQALRLWAGPLKAATPQEFAFRVVILQKTTYEFIARVSGLGEWGVKEKAYTITVY